MIGEVIGNFKIVSQIGRGGMGEVFLAEHTAMAENRVAVKILHPEISRDHEQVQRFFNEARAVNKIKHAGIVKIFDSGMFQDHAYLIMELLEGESLAGRLERAGKLPTAEVAAIGRQIASVLEATHRAGITHRDLKPDNIFLVRDEELGERIKILDFGIAKLSGTLASSGPKTQGTMGTPAYMAPEQWGDSGQVDWRADAYSLGCVVYEMACGQPPFLAKNIAEAYARHLHEVPVAPRTLAPELAASCETLIRRLLAKQPADRAASMTEVVAAFEAIAEGLPLAPPTTPAPAPIVRPREASATTLGSSARELTDFAPKPARRGLLIGVAVAVAVVAIGIVVVTSHDPSKPALIVAVAKPPPDAAPIAIDAAPPPTTITLRVETEPAGADVYRVTDSVRIGQTPLDMPMALGVGELVVLVKKPGFRDERVVLPLAASATRHVVMVGERTRPAIVVAKPPPDAAPPERKKGDLYDPYAPGKK